MLAESQLFAAVLSTVRTPSQFSQRAQNEYLKTVSLGVLPNHSARLAMPKTLNPGAKAREEWRRSVLPSASLGHEQDKIDGGEDFDLDSSVFEEVFPKVERVKKPLGARVRGLPTPKTTLIPDDWKAMQEYMHRGKKERKKEALALQLEWSKKRALEDRATRLELKNEQRLFREEEIRSAGDDTVADGLEDLKEEPLELGLVGGTPNSGSGRAQPKDFRTELQFSSFEDIAQSLKKEEVELRQEEEDAHQCTESDSDEEALAPVVKEKTHLLTSDEMILLKNKNLNFARISSRTWTPLHTLAASGQVYLAAELLKKGVDLNIVDSDGLTPLHRAVYAGRKTMVRMLLKAGANPLVFDRAGATLLHYSARIGNHDISKLLLRHGVDVNVADADGWTPLHVAVQSGRLELIKTLVYGGADINIVNNDGSTALDLSLAFGACFNFYDAIKFLKRRLVYDSERRLQGGSGNYQPSETRT